MDRPPARRLSSPSVPGVLRRCCFALLIALHVLSGAGAARAFVLCLCVDGGVVLESHAETCRCCDADTCCDEDGADEAAEPDGCACSRVGVVSEDASSPRTIDLPGAPAALDPLPRWSSAPIAPLARGPGPIDLDPDPHDPLAALRTVVLRH
jgi:hypothetical protein